MLYLQQHDNLLKEDTELGEQDLLAFSNIRVSIHHVITDRIDHLRPSQQLTLKVSTRQALGLPLTWPSSYCDSPIKSAHAHL